MPAKHGIEFAGHEGDEANDAALFQHDPLGVGARVAKQRPPLCPGGGVQLHPAEHLGLLAAHHVGAPETRTAHAGDDQDRSRPLLDLQQAAGEVLGARGAGHVAGGSPSEIRADHAAQDGRQAVCVQRRTNLGTEHPLRLSGGEPGDPQLERPLGQGLPGLRQGPGAQPGRSPVASQQRSRGHQVRPPSMTRFWPVIMALSSDARNRASRATSSGRMRRFRAT